mmetsp:Transcript_101826/g.311416  ORF Transcript_101826/g.311416 Transcript_101826/m.311416 type:complete len:325 (-) Transcript_101826:168-1142(-)
MLEWPLRALSRLRPGAVVLLERPQGVRARRADAEHAGLLLVAIHHHRSCLADVSRARRGDRGAPSRHEAQGIQRQYEEGVNGIGWLRSAWWHCQEDQPTQLQRGDGFSLGHGQRFRRLAGRDCEFVAICRHKLAGRTGAAGGPAMFLPQVHPRLRGEGPAAEEEAGRGARSAAQQARGRERVAARPGRLRSAPQLRRGARRGAEPRQAHHAGALQHRPGGLRPPLGGRVVLGGRRARVVPGVPPARRPWPEPVHHAAGEDPARDHGRWLHRWHAHRCPRHAALPPRVQGRGGRRRLGGQPRVPEGQGRGDHPDAGRRPPHGEDP